MVRLNRLFICVVLLSNSLKLVESVVHMTRNSTDCFVVIGYHGPLNALVYVVLVLFEDYSLIFCVMFLFWQRGRNVKKSVMDS